MTEKLRWFFKVVRLWF